MPDPSGQKDSCPHCGELTTLLDDVLIKRDPEYGFGYFQQRCINCGKTFVTATIDYEDPAVH